VHLKKGFLAASSGYEFNLVPIAVAVALLLAGSGAYSIDAALGIFWG
jgi:putative oxidoreductase